MSTYSAKPFQTPRPVALLLFEGTKLLDFAGPLQVFCDAKTRDGAKAYDVHLLSETGGCLRTDTVCQIETSPLAAHQDAAWDTVLVSGGHSAYEAMNSEPLRDFINESASNCMTFCISVQNFTEKYEIQLEKYKKYHFPAKIGCSGDF